MAMSDLSASSPKASHVAVSLRGAIKKGELKPGSRVAGVRQLAERFNVSPKTVKRALDILRDERLIRCEHGRGNFVEPLAADDAIDVYLLIWGTRRESCDYYEQVLKIAYPPNLDERFSFTVRTVFKDSGEFKYFDQELARIESATHIKCVLTCAALYDAECFRKLNQLHCPVVFFGDSKYEDATDVPRHQLINQADWTDAIMALARHLNMNELSLFIPDAAFSFYKEYTRRIVMNASALGIKLNLFQLPSSHYEELDQRKIYDTYAKYIRAAKQAGQLNCPVIVYGLIDSIFFSVPEIQERFTSSTPFLQTCWSWVGMKSFYQAAFELIHDVVTTPPPEYQIKRFYAPDLIRDIANDTRYLYQNNELTVIK